MTRERRSRADRQRKVRMFTDYPAEFDSQIEVKPEAVNQITFARGNEPSRERLREEEMVYLARMTETYENLYKLREIERSCDYNYQGERSEIGAIPTREIETRRTVVFQMNKLDRSQRGKYRIEIEKSRPKIWEGTYKIKAHVDIWNGRAKLSMSNRMKLLDAIVQNMTMKVPRKKINF